MRGLLIIAGLILIFALVGWITFNKGPDRATINIESGQIRDDTKRVIESGAELLHRAGDKVEAEANRPTEPAPPSTPPVTEPATPTPPAPVTR